MDVNKKLCPQLEDVMEQYLAFHLRKLTQNPNTYVDMPAVPYLYREHLLIDKDERQRFQIMAYGRMLDMLRMLGIEYRFKSEGRLLIVDDRDIAMGQYYVDVDTAKDVGGDKSMRMISQIHSDGSLTVLDWSETK